MKEYKFDDFEIGDSVYHITNTKIKMIVIDIVSETNIKCRWVNKEGDNKEAKYNFFELMKSDDYRRPGLVSYGVI